MLNTPEIRFPGCFFYVLGFLLKGRNCGVFVLIIAGNYRLKRDARNS